MKLTSIEISNFTRQCKSCQSSSITIYYYTDSNSIFCEKCIMNQNIQKNKPNYTPSLIGNYDKLTFREFNSSLNIVEKQLKELK